MLKGSFTGLKKVLIHRWMIFHQWYYFNKHFAFTKWGKPPCVDSLCWVSNVGTHFVIVCGFSVDQERYFQIFSKKKTCSCFSSTCIEDILVFLKEKMAFSSGKNQIVYNSYRRCCRNPGDRVGLDKPWAKIFNKRFKNRTYLDCCFTVSLCVLYVYVDIYSVVYSKLWALVALVIWWPSFVLMWFLSVRF